MLLAALASNSTATLAQSVDGKKAKPKAQEISFTHRAKPVAKAKVVATTGSKKTIKGANKTGLKTNSVLVSNPNNAGLKKSYPHFSKQTSN